MNSKFSTVLGPEAWLNHKFPLKWLKSHSIKWTFDFSGARWFILVSVTNNNNKMVQFDLSDWKSSYWLSVIKFKGYLVFFFNHIWQDMMNMYVGFWYHLDPYEWIWIPEATGAIALSELSLRWVSILRIWHWSLIC